jgi:hypothetical protein
MVRSAPTSRILTSSDYPRWNDLVRRSEEGAVYHLPDYLDALCEAAGGTFRILAVEKGDELLGGVALYERASRAGTYVSTRHLLYYNGIVLRPYETRYPSERTSRHNEILEALAEGLSRLGYGSITLRCRSPVSDVRVLLARGWTARPNYSYVVPLTDMEALWSRMEQNLRRLVARCAEQGVTVTEDEDFDRFFRLHAQVHERKGARLYLPRDAFQRFFARLRSGQLARLYHARLDSGASVSTQLVLQGPHPVSHTVAAGADADHRNLGATAFLRWNVFQRLSRLGVAANDLTDAALNPVTHFKAQLGGDLTMCLLLESPESPRFRRERRYRELAESVRRGARRVTRRLRPGRRE